MSRTPDSVDRLSRSGVFHGLATVTGATIAESVALVTPALARTPSIAEPAPALPESTSVVAALAAAKETGREVTIGEATSETAEFRAMPDGRVTGTVSSGPARFRENGDWVPIDLTPRRQPDGSVAAGGASRQPPAPASRRRNALSTSPISGTPTAAFRESW